MHELMITAVQGDGNAAFLVGSAYENGSHGLEKNDKEALRYYLMRSYLSKKLLSKDLRRPLK